MHLRKGLEIQGCEKPPEFKEFLWHLLLDKGTVLWGVGSWWDGPDTKLTPNVLENSLPTSRGTAFSVRWEQDRQFMGPCLALSPLTWTPRQLSGQCLQFNNNKNGRGQAFKDRSGNRVWGSWVASGVNILPPARLSSQTRKITQLGFAFPGRIY